MNTNYVKDYDILFQGETTTLWLCNPMKLKIGISPVIDDFEVTCQTIWHFDVGSHLDETWKIQ